MIKKIFVSVLLVTILSAAVFSIYNTTYARSQGQTTTTAGNGQGNGQGGQGGQGQGNGQRGANGTQTGTGIPDPQNGLTEWLTYSGVVSAYAAPNFTLLTSDGQSIAAELGNTSYVTGLGLTLKDGDAVTVVGFIDANGGLALKSLTLTATGETFNFRDDTARPLWAGGKGNGGQGHTTTP